MSFGGPGGCWVRLPPLLLIQAPLFPQRMWGSTQILLLIVHVVALATALFCFGYGLRRLCCSCWVRGGKGAELPAPLGTAGSGTLEGRDLPRGCACLESLAVVAPGTPERVALPHSASQEEILGRSPHDPSSPTFRAWRTDGWEKGWLHTTGRQPCAGRGSVCTSGVHDRTPLPFSGARASSPAARARVLAGCFCGPVTNRLGTPALG